MERIATLQEFVSALNASGVLGQGQLATFDAVKSDLRIPLVFSKDLVGIDTPIDLGFELGGTLSLATSARALFDLGLTAGVDFILNLKPDGIGLAIDRVRVEGELDLGVEDLEASIGLGFLRLQAGGRDPGPGWAWMPA